MASGFDEADVFGTTPSATFFLLRKGRAKFVVKVPADPAETERSALRYRQLLNGMKTLDGDVRVITVKGFTRRNGTRVAPHARVIRVMRQEPFPAFGSPFGLLMPMYRNTLASCSRRLSPPQLLRVLREVRAQLRLRHARHTRTGLAASAASESSRSTSERLSLTSRRFASSFAAVRVPPPVRVGTRVHDHGPSTALT